MWTWKNQEKLLGLSLNDLQEKEGLLAIHTIRFVLFKVSGRVTCCFFFLFQPPSSILAQVQLLNPVPIHAISFNCADTEANQFLCQLAAETGGR